MKLFVFVMLFSVLAQAELSRIICLSEEVRLELVAQNKVTKTETVQAEYALLNNKDSKTVKMLVTTQILKPGEYYSDKEVRVFQAYSEDLNLKLGFIISQVLDKDQKEVRFDLNKFGQDQVELGQCQVTEVE